MARNWTQVKSEKHARGRTDSARVAQLKREMLDEVEADRPSTVHDEAKAEQPPANEF